MVPEKSLPPSLKANVHRGRRSKPQSMNIGTRRGIDSLAPARFGLSARRSMSRGSRRLHSRYGASFFQIGKRVTNKGTHRDIHAEERTGPVRFRSPDIRRFCLRNSE